MSSTSTRLAWPDVARGISIICVILLHATIIVPGTSGSPLEAFNAELEPFRLPLFFLVSGYFSTKILQLSAWDLFSKRLWYLLIPYFIWAGLAFLAFAVPDLMHGDFEGSVAAGLVSNLLSGDNYGWFLPALCLFNVVLWLTRPLPTWAAIAVSFTPMLLFLWQPLLTLGGRIIMFMPVFFLGAYAKGLIRVFTENLRKPKFLIPTIVFFAAGAMLRSYWEDVLLPKFDLLAQASEFWPDNTAHELNTIFKATYQIFMLPGALAVTVLLAFVPLLTTFLQFLGRHTLPLYLGHPLAMALCYVIPREVSLDLYGDRYESFFNETYLWIVLLVIASVLSGYLLHLLSKSTHFSWLMVPPALPATLRHTEQTRETTSATR